MTYPGKVGDEVYRAGRRSGQNLYINMLAAVKNYLGDLDKVKDVVKVQAFVNSKTGFMEQHIVVNAASQLLYDVFGEAGRHARPQWEQISCPMDAPVEIEAIFKSRT